MKRVVALWFALMMSAASHADTVGDCLKRRDHDSKDRDVAIQACSQIIEAGKEYRMNLQGSTPHAVGTPSSLAATIRASWTSRRASA